MNLRFSKCSTNENYLKIKVESCIFMCCFICPQLISVHEQLSKLTGETVIVTNKTKKKPEKKPPAKKEAKQAAPPQPKNQTKQKSVAKAQAAQAQPKAEKPPKKQSASKRSANSK